MSKRTKKPKNTRKKNDSANTEKDVFKRLDVLRKRIGSNGKDGQAWKELAKVCLEQNELAAALTPARRAAELLPDDPDVMCMLAAAEYDAGNVEDAIKLFKNVIKARPDKPQTYHDLATIMHRRGAHQEALELAEKGLELDAKNMRLLDLKGASLRSLHRLDESYEIYKMLTRTHPSEFSLWIDLGNLSHDLGEIEQALSCYEKAEALNKKDATAYSNQLTTLHYHPEKTRDDIFEVCLEWQKKHAPAAPVTPAHITNRNPSRPLRIGMISEGFKKNPVGLMITSALENIPRGHYEFYAYPTNNVVDAVTSRLQKLCARWTPIAQTHGERLRDLIQEDEIDILIDLAGHHRGSRMSTIALKPAPLIIKWVGGLINTTGVDAIDYLISDCIETPEGVDSYYTEKLIRMPGDYICYDPPEYAPAVGSLPAAENGYITFGCFNNPLKINPVLAKEWAELLNQHPASKLFLKSFQYNSEVLCSKVAGWFAAHGIDRARLIFEGSSPHAELLAAYNRVDIALDPWPYSGGLTTCEALLMGVPVVTLPGPTFAGRHSATHLVNAGLPELVTDTWDQYRYRISELVSDLDSLSTIRTHLRTVLLQSAVCNARQFALHLDNALRAIWQRYAENKPPAALSFDNDGKLVFEDASNPVVLQHPESIPNSDDNDFKWEFEGKVIAIDHGGQLLNTPIIQKMLGINIIELFVFDPASNYLKHPTRKMSGIHYYPNSSLGNGKSTTLYACQAETKSGTLKPAPSKNLYGVQEKDLEILAELPIMTIALDAVNNLPSLDYLVLDEFCDAKTILDNGRKSLLDALVVQIKVAFKATHYNQISFADVSKWAEENKFRVYCFHNQISFSHFNDFDDIKNKHASELLCADVILIPEQSRIDGLSKSQKSKLAFIMNTFYNFKDFSYKLLYNNDKSNAKKFLSKPTKKPKETREIDILKKIKNKKERLIIPVVDIIKFNN